MSNSYYYINSHGTITKAIWKETKRDWSRWENDNYFENYPEALANINKINKVKLEQPVNSIPEILI